ncbi:hypothetical protein [Vibrio owensii]|uniref:hypothetical protein n=1 Tax=Vibrio harveyi group TaxID=717610 RepID=UPI003CC50B38
MNKQINSDVLGATKIFELLLKKHKLERHHMSGESKDMILPFFNSWDGLLPIWMIKSDEMSVSMIGKRLWNVVYEGASDSICGLACKDKVDAEPTYDNYPVANEDEIPYAMRFLMCQQAFIENMVFKGRTFEYKDLTGLYDINGPLVEGEVLPFPSEDIITAVRLNQFIIDTNPQRTMELELSNSGVDL